MTSIMIIMFLQTSDLSKGIYFYMPLTLVRGD